MSTADEAVAEVVCTAEEVVAEAASLEDEVMPGPRPRQTRL